MNQMATQVQQQQLMLYQQMLSQQQENAERLRRLEQTVLRSDQTDVSNAYHTSPFSQSSLLQPLSVPTNTLLTTAGRPENNLLATTPGRNLETAANAPTISPFQFRPRPVEGINNVNSPAGAFTLNREAPQQVPASNVYNLRSNRDGALSDAAQNITVTVNNTANPMGRLVQHGQKPQLPPRSSSNVNQQADRSRLYRVEDVVPIETIQASDQRVPPLNLTRVFGNARNRYTCFKDNPGAGNSYKLTDSSKN